MHPGTVNENKVDEQQTNLSELRKKFSAHVLHWLVIVSQSVQLVITEQHFLLSGLKNFPSTQDVHVLGSVGEHLLQPGTVVVNKSEEQQAKLSELRVKEEAHPVHTF